MTFEEALEFVESILNQGHLNKVQEIVFRQSWSGQSYQQMAASCGYDEGYITDVGCKLWQALSRAFGTKVTKNNFQRVVQQQYVPIHTTEQSSSVSAAEVLQAQASVPQPLTTKEIRALQHQDWGDAVDASLYGRAAELTKLEQWILRDCCRLVVVFGMGGIGKTAVVAKLAKQIQGEFEYLIWRSLRNAPLVQDLLADLIQFLRPSQETKLAKTIDARVLQLIQCLKSSRCLLVLDNAETILHVGDRTGRYREGYEGYGQLLRCIAETRHQSCLVLTTREKPRGLAIREGEKLPVRSLRLTGLPTPAGRQIFQAIGSFWASEDEWRVLIERYVGNPLALKIVATVIQDFFNSSVSKFLEFLKQDTFIFDDIRNLLDQHFNRLSDLEQEVMYSLALHQQPVSFPQLTANFFPNTCPSEILEVLRSLQRRSLIEKSADRFTQQPLILKYLRNYHLSAQQSNQGIRRLEYQGRPKITYNSKQSDCESNNANLLQSDQPWATTESSPPNGA